MLTTQLLDYLMPPYIDRVYSSNNHVYYKPRTTPVRIELYMYFGLTPELITNVRVNTDDKTVEILLNNVMPQYDETYNLFLFDEPFEHKIEVYVITPKRVLSLNNDSVHVGVIPNVRSASCDYAESISEAV